MKDILIWAFDPNSPWFVTVSLGIIIAATALSYIAAVAYLCIIGWWPLALAVTFACPLWLILHAYKHKS